MSLQHNAEVQVQLVGRARQSIVALAGACLRMGHVLVGRRLQSKISLTNFEDVPLQFIFEAASLACQSGTGIDGAQGKGSDAFKFLTRGTEWCSQVTLPCGFLFLIRIC